MKYYYSVDAPTLWELIYEDEFNYYLKPLSRLSSKLDMQRKWYWCEVFTTKEELIEYSNKFNDNEIRKLEEQIERQKKYKEQRIWLINNINN